MGKYDEMGYAEMQDAAKNWQPEPLNAGGTADELRARLNEAHELLPPVEAADGEPSKVETVTSDDLGASGGASRRDRGAAAAKGETVEEMKAREQKEAEEWARQQAADHGTEDATRTTISPAASIRASMGQLERERAARMRAAGK